MQDEERREILRERGQLAEFRLRQIGSEETVSEPFRRYFRQAAGLLLQQEFGTECIAYEQEEIACEWLGVLYGRHLSLLYARILETVPQEGEIWLILQELLIQVYNLFEEINAEFLSQKQVHDSIYWFFSDYSELFVQEDLRWLQQGRVPPLEERIWALYGDKKYKERYLQAFYLAAANLRESLDLPAPVAVVGQGQGELLLKMKEERNQMLVQLRRR